MSEIKKIPISQIIVTGDNPRQGFNEENLRNLGESIRTHGLLQPIIVRPRENYFELVVGERRLRASELIGLTEIEARIEDIDDATLMELRLIENTQREDLTDAEKGDAVYALMERFPEKYPTIKSVAQSIGMVYGTARKWTVKSRKISSYVNRLIGENSLMDFHAKYLLKYDHVTQNKLADAIVRNEIPTTSIDKFIKLYDADPEADLDGLANEALEVKKVEVEITKLSEEARKEIEEILEEKEKGIEEARERALQKARRAPRRKRPKKVKPRPEEKIREKAAKLTEKLAELEPEKRQEVAEAVGRRLDTLAKSVDKETLDWMEKWQREMAPRIKEETPERYARRLEDIIHGIWMRIWVEYPPSVKAIGQKQLVSSLSMERLERLQNTIRRTISELDGFKSVVESELLTRGHKRT